jgi:hypothetical protein
MGNCPGLRAIQRAFLLAVLLCATVWCVTAPSVLTASGVVALVGFFLTFALVAAMTYSNSQPMRSLAQLLPGTKHSDLVEDRRDDR